MIHMEYYLIVSAIMFFAGIYEFFTRRNTLAILISIELISTSQCSTVSFSLTEWKGISLPCSPLPSRPLKRQ